MEEDTSSEPVFRANKRRKVFRKRESPAESAVTQTVPEDGNITEIQYAPKSEANGARVVRFQKKMGVQSRGIGFTSNIAGRNAEAPAAERALVLKNGDEGPAVAQADRFVKPTGRVAVADNKHMVAYIDSKMAELRSASNAPINGPNAQDSLDFSPPVEEPATQTHAQNDWSAGDSTSAASGVPAGPTTYQQSQARSTRVYQRPTKRRQPQQRDHTDVARDSIIDQIMQESQVPLYDRSSSHTHGNDVDNDEATAEAFKVQLLAEMEEQNRRRPPPPNTTAKGDNVSHGPKLGGSRQQRERMVRAREEAKANGVKK